VATEKQILANRRNAKASTGPKTAAGRVKSSRNSLNHGLTASQITLYDESPAEFVAFHRGLREAWNPVGAFEEQQLERMASCAWRLRRIPRIESDLFASGRLAAEHDFAESLNERTDQEEAFLSGGGDRELGEEGTTRLRELIKEKRIWANDTLLNNDLIRWAAARSIGAVFQRLAGTFPMTPLVRYEASLERSYYRALHNLERAQARRKGEVVAAPLVVDVGGERSDTDPIVVSAYGCFASNSRAK